MIIDECVWADILGTTLPGWEVVKNSLLGRRIAPSENHRLHVGGRYWKKKVEASGSFRAFVVVLGASARVVRVDDRAVDIAEAKWKLVAGLKCDSDHWALALAQVANTRLLASNDEGLKHDFRHRIGGNTICRGTAKAAVDTQKVLRQSK